MCNPCDSKAALLLETRPEKKPSSACYFAQPGFHRRGVEQKDESARDVYPPWARVCPTYMKGILLSPGRHSGGNTLGAAAREGSGVRCLPRSPRRGRGLSVSPAPSSGTPAAAGGCGSRAKRRWSHPGAWILVALRLWFSQAGLVAAPLAHGHGWTAGLAAAPARLWLLFCTSRENRCAYFCFGFPICVTHVMVE